MTRQNFASINVIIDESGSMEELASDTIGGFNAFLKEQKAYPGEAILTLAKFSSTVSYVYDCVNIKDAAPLTPETYRPTGGTALLDAVGDVIKSTGQKLAAMKEEDRPDKVVVLIITDGHENSSFRHTKEAIKAMIEHQRAKYSWNFVFIGADVDAFTAGVSLGVSANNSVRYTASARGTHQLYGSISASTNSFRAGQITLQDAYLGGNSVEVAQDDTKKIESKVDVKVDPSVDIDSVGTVLLRGMKVSGV